MTIEVLSKMFNEGVTSAANKVFERLSYEMNEITKYIEEIDRLIEYFINTYHYSIEYYFEDEFEPYFFRIQRSEFSRQKYFYFNVIYTITGPFTMLHSFKYKELKDEDFSTMPMFIHIDNDELINILEKLKRINMDTINEITEIISREMQIAKDYEIEVAEPEPIKPKGNPFAGETWKDRKHKFKGGR